VSDKAQEQNKILRRVRKMIKLANDAGATEGERDNALRMVQATLAKYNISMQEVDASEEQEKRGALREAFLGKPWAIQIAAAIGRMCFCHYYYQTLGGNAGPTQKALHTFIGLESNVTTAKEMARFVVESVNREAQRYQRSIGGGYADYRAFAQGAAAKIRLRCAVIQHEASTQGVAEQAVEADDHASLAKSGAGTALVLASLYKTEEDANKAWMEERKIDLKPGRSQSIDTRRGYAHKAGAEYGAKVSLHRQVGGSAKNQIK
jgi:hypothetical protein